MDAIANIITEGDGNGNGNGNGDIRRVQEMDDAVASMLSDKFLKLSVEERTNKLEEMHGVRSQAVEESPSFVRQSLRDFQNELDSMVLRNSHHEPPVNAYILMLEKRRRSEKLLQQQRHPQPQSQSQSQPQQHTQDDTETIRKNHYALDDPDFRLRFLRCDFFDVSKAVARFWNYLEHTHLLWGDIMLERPIGMEDVLRHKEDKKYLKEGFHQILPVRDRSGRRILATMGNVMGDFPFMTIHRVVFLMIDYLSRDSAESQRLGAVVVEELHAFKNLTMHPKLLELMSESLKAQPTRMICAHVSIPDSIMARILVNVWVLKGYKDDPTGFSFHKGTVLETRYELGAFGIPTHLLPITDTGNIKTSYFGQWIKIRKILEREQNKRRTTILGAPLLAEDDEGDGGLDEDMVIVECPCLNDIVFRQGTPSWDNPGNAVFRDLMMEHFEGKEERKRLGFDRDSGGGDSGSTVHHDVQAANNATHNNEDQIFCDKLIIEIQERRGGRFLEWNKKFSAWIQMKSDTKQQRGKIRQKVSIAIYHFGRNLATTLLLKRTATEHQSTGGRNAKRNATRRAVPSISPSKSISSLVSSQQKSDDSYGNTSSDEEAKHYAFCEGRRKSASPFENNPCCRGPSRKRPRDSTCF